MEKKGTITRILAIVGTILVWIPLVLPIVFGALHYSRSGRFLVDYLMPGELFPVILVGGALLIWAAFRSGKCKKILIWASASAVFFLLVSQGLAVITGLASGETEAEGLPFIGVMILWVLFCLSVIAIGVGGIRLIRRLPGGAQKLPTA